MKPVLEVRDLQVAYGKVEALRGLDLTVGDGEIVALLGNNGAGKSTTVSTISGLVRSRAGSITAFGQDITRATPWAIVEQGIIHVPEGRRIFSRLTVHENLQLGGYTVKDNALIDRRIADVYDLLPRMAERRAQQGGTLSGGEQQMLAIGRALMARPNHSSHHASLSPSRPSSRCPTWSISPIAAMCSTPARSPSRALRRSFAATPRSSTPTSGSDRGGAGAFRDRGLPHRW